MAAFILGVCTGVILFALFSIFYFLKHLKQDLARMTKIQKQIIDTKEEHTQFFEPATEKERFENAKTISDLVK